MVYERSRRSIRHMFLLFAAGFQSFYEPSICRMTLRSVNFPPVCSSVFETHHYCHEHETAAAATNRVHFKLPIYSNSRTCQLIITTANAVNNTRSLVLGAIVCKTVRPICYQTAVSSVCLSVCLSVCNVGVLWPNGWMDQDETWHAGRPRPWPHCVRWGPSSPSPEGAQPPVFGSYLLWPNSWMDQAATW